jgi:uncharacterized membrane protein YgcG
MKMREQPEVLCLRRRRRWLGVWILAALGVAAGAKPGRAEKPSELTQQGYVNDFGNFIDEDSRAKIGGICRNFDGKTGDRLLIVTVDSTENLTPGQFAEELRKQWIGVEEIRECTMIVVVNGKGRVGFGYGSSIEAALPHEKLESIFQASIPVGGNDYGLKLAFMSQRLAEAIEEGIAHPPPPLSDSHGPSEDDTGLWAGIRERLSKPRNAALAICAVMLVVVLLIGRLARRSSER